MRLTGAWRDVWKVDGTRYWLLEMGANRGDDQEAGTEYWAVFLPESAVASLALACSTALFGSKPYEMRTLLEQQDRADKPTLAAMRDLIERGSLRGWEQMLPAVSSSAGSSSSSRKGNGSGKGRAS